MQLQVKTPPTRYTAKCKVCGYEIYVDGENLGVVNFEAYGWSEDKYGRPICPECLEVEV